MRPFGYHISGGTSLGSSLWQAVESYSITAAQVFLGPPQTAKLSKVTDAERSLWDRTLRVHNIKAFVHAPYVLHAFPRPDRVRQNNHALRNHFELAASLHCSGYVVHMGSTKSYEPQLLVGESNKYYPDHPLHAYYEAAEALCNTIGKNTLSITPLLFENCASGNSMSGTLRNILLLVENLRLKGYNVGLCWDTLHSWAWGDDEVFSALDSDPISLPALSKYLALIHLNSAPAKVKRGSKRDLHESLLDGSIPMGYFRHFLLQHPETPVIVERDQMKKVLSDREFVLSFDRQREESGQPVLTRTEPPPGVY